MKHTIWIKQSARHWSRMASQVLLMVALLMGGTPFPMTPPSPDEFLSQPIVWPQPAWANVQAVAAQSRPISAQDVVVEPSPPPSAIPSTSNSRHSDSSPFNSAYVTDVDLGDGRRQAIVSSSPVNYRAEDGSWQPIDPRFEAVAGGFVNRTNVLQISASDRQAVLRLQHDDNLVGWEPQAVVLTTATGDETVLAEPLEAAESLTGTLAEDGRTIHYSQSWTLPGLSEEIVSDPGQVEQSLVFALPPGEGGRESEGKFLTLRATLHLLPGTDLYAEGARQTAAFTTAGEVEIRDAQGKTTLTLAPVRAFEQAHPGVGVAGRYRLTPQQEGEWQVAVDTPWDWWTDPDRAYPAVLDPTMIVIRAHSSARTTSDSDYTLPWEPGDDPLDPFLVVGQSPQSPGVYHRTLIRFPDLPSLPSSYQVESAMLYAVPVSGYYPPQGATRGFATADIDVRPLTTDFQSGFTDWGSYSASGAIGTFSASVNPPERRYEDAPFWGSYLTLQDGPTGLVTNWLTDPQSNHGLELRLTHESSCEGDPNGCQLVMFPNQHLGTGYWTDADKEELRMHDGLGGRAAGGGFMLLIEYTPPTLVNAEPRLPYFEISMSNPDPDLPTTEGDTYLKTHHTYVLPSSSAPWMAVGVKGLRHEFYGADVGYRAGGSLGVGYLYGLALGDPKSVGEPDQPNYMIFHNGWGNGKHVAVLPPDLSLPENKGQLETYMIEAAASTPLPDFTPWPDPLGPGTGIFTYTFNISSTHVLTTFALNLTANTRVWIDTSDSSSFIQARVFPPSTPDRAARSAGRLAGQTINVESDEGGVWGLVVEYTGDVNPGEGEMGPPINIPVQIVARACPIDSIPIEDGCQSIKKPHGPDHDYPGQPATFTMTVGDFVIYSEAGFKDPDPQGIYTTKKRSETDNKLYTPLIGWGVYTDRLVMVAGDPITFRLTETVPGGYVVGGLDSNVWLAVDPPGTLTPTLELWRGGFEGHPFANGYLEAQDCNRFYPCFLPLDETDRASSDFEYKVNVRQDATHTQRAEGHTTLTRTVEIAPDTFQTLTFSLDWHVQAEGYTPVYSAVAQTDGSTEIDVGSLSAKFGAGWTIDYENDVNLNGEFGLFTNLRNQGQIVLPDKLGGAWKPIQTVIMRRGEGLTAQAPPCPGGYCLDLRAPADDVLDDPPKREWEMPDVEVTGTANTVMFSRPGDLTVFSTDQPNAVNASGTPFSFRAFESDEVKVSRESCPGGSMGTVIRGSTKISLPGLGSDTDPTTGIETEFVLCETKLHGMKLAFKGPPDIPVGSTGVMLDRITGDITLDPDHTEITLSTEFYAGSGLVDGAASIKIDTRGLFDIQATGTVVAAVNFQGHAWVAWNPLDTGIDVYAWYSDWLTGQVHAHLWKGQGWQHRYWWLPDNNETHFAGSISAQVTIRQGQAFEWWWIDIPPCKMTFKIEVAFGQFCSDPSCTQYEWGVKGVYTVVGYDVGLYYGFGSGSFDFILGSDDHVLIDQVAPTYAAHAALAERRGVSPVPLVNGEPANFNVLTVPDPAAPVYTRPLTITANTGSFIVGMSWEQGSPELTLIKPGGIEITPTNAASHGVAVSVTTGLTGSILYGTQNPTVGTWYARVSNAEPDNNYQLVYFANKKAPSVALTAPASDEVFSTNELSYTIEWTAPADSPLSISLYYSVTETTVLSPDQKYGGVIMEHLPITTTHFDWDMSYLATGRYHVYARVSEPQLAGPDSLWQTRPYSLSNQLPGFVTLHAPGSIRITDLTPPATPTTPTLTNLDEAMMVCWDPNSEHDLAGYELQYMKPDWQWQWVTRTLRLHATIPYRDTGSSARAAPLPVPTYKRQECARIGGLNNGAVIFIRPAAYDASDNRSDYGDWISKTVSSSTPSYAVVPDSFVAAPGVDNTVVLTWTGSFPPCPGCPGGYWVHYAQEAPVGMGQPGTGALGGTSPVYAGRPIFPPGRFTVQGLDPGYWYHFAVQTKDDDGRYSPMTPDLAVLVTDGVDANGDGVLDDWAQAHDVIDPYADPDRDGCSNLEEFSQGTDPHNPDTDGDGFSDCEEYVAGCDPTDSRSISITAIISGVIPLPRLSLNTDHLTFRTYQGGPTPALQGVEATNTGGGVLTSTLTTNAPWLQSFPCLLPEHPIRVKPNCWSVRVSKSSLVRGHYTGVITITGEPGSRTQDSPQQIAVDLWVAAGDPPGDGHRLYLPLVVRSY